MFAVSSAWPCHRTLARRPWRWALGLSGELERLSKLTKHAGGGRVGPHPTRPSDPAGPAISGTSHSPAPWRPTNAAPRRCLNLPSSLLHSIAFFFELYRFVSNCLGFLFLSSACVRMKSRVGGVLLREFSSRLRYL